MKFLLGLAIGFTAAILFAPARGDETREKLMSRARDLAEAPREKLHDAAEEFADTAKEKAGEYGGKVGHDAAEKAAAAVIGKLERTA